MLLWFIQIFIVLEKMAWFASFIQIRSHQAEDSLLEKLKIWLKIAFFGKTRRRNILSSVEMTDDGFNRKFFLFKILLEKITISCLP